MRVLKGIVLGALFWFVGIIICLCSALVRGQPVSTSHATGLSAVKDYTLQNPLFWLSVISALAAGLVVARFWKKI